MFDDLKDMRLMSFVGVLGLQLAGLAVAFFWMLGAFNLLSPSGYGQITLLTGMPYIIFLAFPALLALFSIFAWVAFFDKKDMLANALLSVPLVVLLGLYFYLTTFRQWLVASGAF